MWNSLISKWPAQFKWTHALQSNLHQMLYNDTKLVLTLIQPVSSFLVLIIIMMNTFL